MGKIISIVGARPQFIKAKPLIDALKKRRARHILIHTGQHYDYRMSKVFFDELGIPEPDYNLGVGSMRAGRQTALMIERIEKTLAKERPAMVIAYGDTNSTLAAAVAAVKLGIPVSHVEAGLRSYDKRMPEEINRVLTDYVSNMLFCPTREAVLNLAREGMRNGVYLVGDTMYDAIKSFIKSASARSHVLARYNLEFKGYLLATIHRQSNADDSVKLRNIFKGFARTNEKIILPLHPRTGKSIKKYGIKIPQNVTAIKPVGYLDMLMLEKNARIIMTDSGGMQKESFWLGVPCLTLRNETEWVETVKSGWNRIVGTDPARIAEGVRKPWPGGKRPSFYGDGHAALRIAGHVMGRGR